MLKPETLPALNRMRPFTNLQLAQALCLARLLANYNADCIPDERQVLVREACCGGGVRAPKKAMGVETKSTLFFLHRQREDAN